MTNVPYPGNYIIRIDTNPSHYVSETNFLDNDIVCDLSITENDAKASNCHIPDDYAAEELDRMFKENIYNDWAGGISTGLPEMNG